MSNEENRLSRAHTYIVQVLKKRNTGVCNIVGVDLALEHAEAWASVQMPSTWERGGSSSPLSKDEAEEIRRVQELGIRGVERIPEITRLMDDLGRELYDLTQRLTATVDPKKLGLAVIPGCRSCNRTLDIGDTRIGGHFAPVYAKAKSSGLCRWCYDYKHATGRLPAIKAIDIYHRQSPRAAHQWLASQSAVA